MQGLAGFVMRGRSQAILVVTCMALLSVLLPPLGWLSGAALVLVTLRKGPNEGVLVMVGALVAGAVMGMLTLGSALPAGSFLVVQWLPLWLVAVVFRSTMSMATALECAAGLALLVVAVIYGLTGGDPGPWWQELLGAAVGPMLGDLGPEQVEAVHAAIAAAAGYLTGLMVTAGMLNLYFGLLLGRVWQARLYNPGGFRREFHALRLHRVTAYLAIALFALALGIDGPGLPVDLGAVMLMLFAVGGLALMHALVATRGKGRIGWLVALYVLLVLALLKMAVVLAMAGLAHALTDLGQRLAGKPRGGEAE